MLHSILILDTWERGDAPEIVQWVASGFPFQEAPVSCFQRNAACPQVLFCLFPTSVLNVRRREDTEKGTVGRHRKLDRSSVPEVRVLVDGILVLDLTGN